MEFDTRDWNHCTVIYAILDLPWRPEMITGHDFTQPMLKGPSCKHIFGIYNGVVTSNLTAKADVVITQFSVIKVNDCKYALVAEYEPSSELQKAYDKMRVDAADHDLFDPWSTLRSYVLVSKGKKEVVARLCAGMNRLYCGQVIRYLGFESCVFFSSLAIDNYTHLV